MNNEYRAALVAAVVAALVLLVAERRWAVWRMRVWNDLQKRAER